MKIAFIGDSYSAGYLLSDISKRWTTALCGLSAAVEVNVARSGSGYCFPGTGATFPQQASQIVANHSDVDIVIVAGGHNDSVSSLTLAEIESKVELTFNTLRSGLPTAKIYAMTYWHYLQPTERIMALDSIITRVSSKFDVDEIKDSLWWRVSRREWSFDDGHPNEAGNNAMASIVNFTLFGDIDSVESYGKFVRPFAQDATFSGEANLAEGIVFNAQPGLWRLEGRQTLYGPCGGWHFVSINGSKIAVRGDLSGTPTSISRSELVAHAGGDMRITIGYSTANGSATIIGNGTALVEATALN